MTTPLPAEASALLQRIQQVRNAGFDHLARGLADVLRSQIVSETVRAAVIILPDESVRSDAVVSVGLSPNLHRPLAGAVPIASTGQLQVA